MLLFDELDLCSGMSIRATGHYLLSASSRLIALWWPTLWADWSATSPHPHIHLWGD